VALTMGKKNRCLGPKRRVPQRRRGGVRNKRQRGRGICQISGNRKTKSGEGCSPINRGNCEEKTQQGLCKQKKGAFPYPTVKKKRQEKSRIDGAERKKPRKKGGKGGTKCTGGGGTHSPRQHGVVSGETGPGKTKKKKKKNPIGCPCRNHRLLGEKGLRKSTAANLNKGGEHQHRLSARRWETDEKRFCRS